MTEPHEVYLELVAEHAELNQLLDSLKAAIDDRAGEQEMSRLTTALGRLLEEHFRHEEQQGLFREVVKKAPWLKSQADKLRDQHAQLLEAAGEVVVAIEAGSAGHGSWNTIEDEYEKFLSFFQAHEHEENRLLQDAYEQDVGDKD